MVAAKRQRVHNLLVLCLMIALVKQLTVIFVAQLNHWCLCLVISVATICHVSRREPYSFIRLLYTLVFVYSASLCMSCFMSLRKVWVVCFYRIILYSLVFVNFNDKVWSLPIICSSFSNIYEHQAANKYLSGVGLYTVINAGCFQRLLDKCVHTILLSGSFMFNCLNFVL